MELNNEILLHHRSFNDLQDVISSSMMHFHVPGFGPWYKFINDSPCGELKTLMDRFHADEDSSVLSASDPLEEAEEMMVGMFEGRAEDKYAVVVVPDLSLFNPLENTRYMYNSQAKTSP